jgi:hypothetical protein
MALCIDWHRPLWILLLQILLRNLFSTYKQNLPNMENKNA